MRHTSCTGYVYEHLERGLRELLRFYYRTNMSFYIRSFLFIPFYYPCTVKLRISRLHLANHRLRLHYLGKY